MIWCIGLREVLSKLNARYAFRSAQREVIQFFQANRRLFPLRRRPWLKYPTYAVSDSYSVEEVGNPSNFRKQFEVQNVPAAVA